jgi:hypothetical protein
MRGWSYSIEIHKLSTGFFQPYPAKAGALVVDYITNGILFRIDFGGAQLSGRI